ncbi:predicted metal-dependent phosphohydrolase [Thermococcus onnurineus NA1]|uniref:Predicted metal-dependent phosphohydrolase n=1 Tax=Thermococcus onnurineus (strain NA1) TaxID=523850 RepID=B6YW67_THEON|nr:HD domain-containing protein [Thermococcus onnurineus]ACJ17433.1 predicted metal-dependent phosphohydrolase [Thermococcus onnurineus NA1]
MYTEEDLLREIRELMEDDELYQMYERAFREHIYYFETTNYIVLNIYQFNDHGPIHVLLTTRRALELLKIIKKFGIETTAEKLGKPFRWSKFIVAFGALFHDVGNMIHRINHYEFSALLTEPIIDKLAREFETDDWLLLKALTLNAIYTHDEHVPCTTIEGSLVTIADGCDMEAGRSRLVHKKDRVDIHAVSALAIEKVEIREGNEEQPILIEIWMKHLAGVFQVDEILTKKVKSSVLSGKVRIRIYVGEEIMEKVI